MVKDEAVRLDKFQGKRSSEQEAQIRALEPGDSVRLRLQAESGTPNSDSEYFWVEIDELDVDYFSGYLLDEPVSKSLKPDSVLEFATANIFDIAEKWALAELRMIVGATLYEDSVVPGLVFKEEPVFNEDSGWRAFLGTEQSEELDKRYEVNGTDGQLSQMVGFYLARRPELGDLLRSAFERGAWRWDGDAGAYKEVSIDGVTAFSDAVRRRFGTEHN